MDVDRGVRVAVDTGTVTLGSDRSVQALKLGKGKLVIIAKNCPEEVRDDVMYYSKLSDIPVYTYDGSSVDLGSVCGKPFTVAILIIKDPGDSTILEAAEHEAAENSVGIFEAAENRGFSRQRKRKFSPASKSKILKVMR